VILTVEQERDNYNCRSFFMFGKNGTLKAIILPKK